MRKLLRLLSSLSPPSPYSFLDSRNSSVHDNGFYSSVPAPKIVFDLLTLLVIAGFLLLSLIAFAFIFNLHLRSRRAHYLQNFSSFWTIRSLLVSLASLWAVNEILRLPFVRRKHSYPFLPSISLQQQASICKLHVVLSLGFLEPGFLITVFLLVNLSIQKRKSRRLWSLISVLTLCCPIIFLQILFVYFSPVEAQLARFRHRSSVLSTDQYGNKTMLCIYPIFSCVIFGVFALAYSVAFLLSCWRVMRFVINKRIGNRINLLAVTVIVALTAQILCFSLSWRWMPEDVAYGGVVLAMFLSVVWCMAVGEVLLVLTPIRDSLAAGETVASGSRRPAEERKQVPGQL
ncbi:UNVERIFIED_CONTAM: hypothetical protein Slati_4084400 [Sesamum latifolium]|uniref:Uncharacterized protein n=1 Tax=Sesamum latifolium TaxID=2727402 RepID=A0AAW2T840_9LAMI